MRDTVYLFLVFLSIQYTGIFALPKYEWHCDLREEPIVELQWGEPSQSYVVWKDTGERIYNNDRNLEEAGRSLRGSNRGVPLWVDESVHSPRREAQVQSSNKPNVFARRCPCWNPVGLQRNDFYCPVSKTHCGLTADWTAMSNRTDPFDYDYDEPGCVNVERKQSFAKNVWPIVTVWYLAIVLCLCMTRPGQHAMGGCISKLCCFGSAWNVHAVNRIMRNNPNFTNRVIFQHMAQETRSATSVSQVANRLSFAGFEVTFELAPMSQQENDGAGEEVLLRTKTFRYDKVDSTDSNLKSDEEGVDGTRSSNLPAEVDNGSHDNTVEKEGAESSLKRQREESTTSTADNDADATPIIPGEDNRDALNKPKRNEWTQHPPLDSELVSCTICHLEIEDGERVGDLACGHTFHVDCLKLWLVRRNVCPLCMAKDIATPRRETSDASPQGSFLGLRPELVVSGE